MAEPKISILGDSISTLEGYNPPGFLAFYSQRGLPVEQTWWQQVIDHQGGRLLVNNSFCGSTAASASPVVETFPSGGADGRIALGEDPDQIFIYLGVNDLVYGMELTGKDLDHFEGGYANMIRRLQDKYPHAQIYCIIPPYDHKQAEIIEHIADKLDVQTIPIKQMYETYDGFHPTPKGMKQLADQVIAGLDALNS